MSEEPRRLLERLTDAAFAVAIAMVALWIGAKLIASVWPVIVLTLVVSAAGLAAWRWWRSRHW